MTAKILVTGANGQLGSELQLLAKRGSTMEFLFTDVQELDITNSAQVLAAVRTMQPQFIVNCAAYTAVDKAENDYDKAYLLNAAAAQNLTAAAQLVQAYYFHISTDYVFDGRNYQPYRETDTPAPLTIYGKTKLCGEEFALSYSKSVVIRTAWLYSKFGSNFVKTMLRLGGERKSVDVVAEQIGSPTYAADLAAAILSIIVSVTNNTSIFTNGIFHYTNEGVCSWYDFAVATMRFAGLPCAVNPIDSAAYPTPAVRPPYSVLHKGRIKQCYDLTIRHWQEALAECVKLC